MSNVEYYQPNLKCHRPTYERSPSRWEYYQPHFKRHPPVSLSGLGVLLTPSQILPYLPASLSR